MSDNLNKVNKSSFLKPKFNSRLIEKANKKLEFFCLKLTYEDSDKRENSSCSSINGQF
jgi:hypothetical protein